MQMRVSLVGDECFPTGRQTLATVLESIEVGLAELKADAVQEDNLRHQGIGHADDATNAGRVVAAIAKAHFGTVNLQVLWVYRGGRS
jgi:hypothetical protein